MADRSSLKLKLAVAAAAAKARKAQAQCYGDTLSIEDWLRHYFPNTFSRPFTFYQKEYWQWVAALRSDKAQAPRVECHPRGVGKCLAGSTLVLLADGSQKPIADVVVGESVISYNYREHRWESDRITNKWEPGRKAVLRVTTASGKWVILTPEHRVLSLGGWLRAGQLSDGHWLAGCDGIGQGQEGNGVAGAVGMAGMAGAGEGGIHPQTPPTFAEGGRAEGRVEGPDASVPQTKRQSLEAKGWKRTTVKEFLNLTDAEAAEVEESVPRWKQSSERPNASVSPKPVKARKAKAERGLDGDNRLHCSAVVSGEWASGVAGGVGGGDQEAIAQQVQSTDSDVLRVLASTPVRGIQSTRKDTPHTPKDPYALQWERVVSVEEAGEVECFDVEVEKNHCLVTNGLVSHNSTGAETAAVYALAKKIKKYVLYVSATDDQATKHLRAIKTKLENPELLRDYPHLKPKIEVVHKKVANWSAERLRTQGGQIVECISILGNSRGFKSEDSARPDLIVLDDIDSSKESFDVTKKKLDIIATEILPTGTYLTDVLMPQNLIHRDSVCAMILDKRAQILMNRQFSGPYPLVKNVVCEREDREDGSSSWRIVSGEPFDPAVGLAYSEHLLNLMGPDAWERECQQDVWRVAADKDFREWDEVYHVSTWSEVVAGFKRQGYELDLYSDGRVRVPSRWNVSLGWDVGTTREHPSAVAIVTRPDERFPLSDTVLVVGEVVMPEYPYDSTVVPEQVSPGRTVRAIKARLAEMGVSHGQIELALMSHEASSARNAVLLDLPEEDQIYFNKWKTGRGNGVPHLQQHLEIDRKKPHPFRVYPKGHPKEGEPLMGKPRVIFVVEDGQGELFVDVNGNLRVRGAKNAKGFARARFEIPIYSWRNTGQKKIDDDFVDCFLPLWSAWAISAGGKTPDERFDDSLPEHLRWETIEAQSRIATKDIYSRMVDRYRDSLEEFRQQQREGEQTQWEKTWGKFI